MASSLLSRVGLGAVAARPRKQAVLKLAREQRRGVGHTAADRAEMEAAIDALVAAAPPPRRAGLSASWRLEWTSEQETLFLLERGVLGRASTGAVQRVDTSSGTLSNEVELEEGWRFVVSSGIDVEEGAREGGAIRTQFSFTGARLQAGSTALPLPPFGRGWFDTVYLDNDMRVARDSRGDTLVTTREGPP